MWKRVMRLGLLAALACTAHSVQLNACADIEMEMNSTKDASLRDHLSIFWTGMGCEKDIAPVVR